MPGANRRGHSSLSAMRHLEARGQQLVRGCHQVCRLGGQRTSRCCRSLFVGLLTLTAKSRYWSVSRHWRSAFEGFTHRKREHGRLGLSEPLRGHPAHPPRRRRSSKIAERWIAALNPQCGDRHASSDVFPDSKWPHAGRPSVDDRVTAFIRSCRPRPGLQASANRFRAGTPERVHAHGAAGSSPHPPARRAVGRSRRS